MFPSGVRVSIDMGEKRGYWNDNEKSLKLKHNKQWRKKKKLFGYKKHPRSPDEEHAIILKKR